MWTQFKKLIKDTLTENDGASYDFVRVIVAFCGITGFPTFLGCTVYSVYSNPDHHFDMIGFGTAFAAVLAGLATTAIGVGQKQKTDIHNSADTASQ